MEISPYDKNRLRNLETDAVCAIQEYGSSSYMITRAFAEAYELGFTAVNRGEAVVPRTRDGFAQGDVVTWGTHTKKTGTVEEVVQPGQQPNRDRFLPLYKSSGVGGPRNEVSYVVRVAKPGTKGKVYWPFTSQLLLVKETDEPVSPR